MNRSLLTLAALLCAGAAAQAQSPGAGGPTIYGLIDLGIERLSNVGASGASRTGMPGLTGSLPSRLGFRGSEDLGDGLRALYTLEMGLAVDTGGLNQGGRAFGRQSFVGLQGRLGTLSVGRQYTMLFWSQLDADILGPSVFGSGSMDSYLPNARTDNSLAYRGSFGPWTVGATYSVGRDAVNASSPSGTNCAGENANDTSACREWSAMLKYDGGGWGATAAIDRIHGGSGAFAGLTSSGLTDTRSTVTGWATVKGVKLGAGLIARRNQASATAPRSDLWYLGATWRPVPLVALDAQVFKLDYQHSANGATLVALRATYSLSKSTAIYATAGHIANDGTLALSVSNGTPGAGPAAGTNQKGLAAGLRMAF